CAKWGSRSDVW
nr:immunoglobulin heavy chain junction region [Macaca mulatta]